MDYYDIPKCGELCDINHGVTWIRRAIGVTMIFLSVVSCVI